MIKTIHGLCHFPQLPESVIFMFVSSFTAKSVSLGAYFKVLKVITLNYSNKEY